MDDYGCMRTPIRATDATRVVGLAMVLLGTWLVVRH